MAVPYMRPSDIQPYRPQGGGLGGAMQAFEAGRNIAHAVRGDIDSRRKKREMDKWIASLGEEGLTQEKYIEGARLFGPKVAADLMAMHEQYIKLKDTDRTAAHRALAGNLDFAAAVVDSLRQMPEDRRMDMYTQGMQGIVGQGEYGKRLAQTLTEHFADGDFSDARLDHLSHKAAVFGRWQEVYDNRLKAKALKAAGDADRAAETDRTRIETAGKVDEAQIEAAGKVEQERVKAKSDSPQEVVNTAREMVSQFGGRPADWLIFLRGDDKMIREGEVAGPNGEPVIGYVNVATGRALDLGTFSGSAAGSSGAPPSVDMLRRTDRHGAGQGRAAPADPRVWDRLR